MPVAWSIVSLAFIPGSTTPTKTIVEPADPAARGVAANLSVVPPVPGAAANLSWERHQEPSGGGRAPAHNTSPPSPPPSPLDCPADDLISNCPIYVGHPGLCSTDEWTIAHCACSCARAGFSPRLEKCDVVPPALSRRGVPESTAFEWTAAVACVVAAGILFAGLFYVACAAYDVLHAAAASLVRSRRVQSLRRRAYAVRAVAWAASRGPRLRTRQPVGGTTTTRDAAGDEDALPPARALSDEERRAVTVEANQTAAPLPHPFGTSNTVDGLLDLVARAHPHAIAVRDRADAGTSGGDHSGYGSSGAQEQQHHHQLVELTYRELAERTSALATGLAAHGLPPRHNPLLGLLFECGPIAVIAVFGVLKAKAAYVPLDIAFPRARVVEIVDGDAKCAAVLVQSIEVARPLWPPSDKSTSSAASAVAPLRAAPFLATIEGRLVAHSSAAAAAAPPPAPPDDTVAADDTVPGGAQPSSSSSRLVYVMYTSGSTGKPKGVMVSHGSLVTRCGWLQAAYGLKVGEAVPLKTKLIFGISEWELFWTLNYGGTLEVVPSAALADPPAFVSCLRVMRPAVLFTVPSHLTALLPHLRQQRAASSPLRTVRHVICCGEALPLSTVRDFYALVDGASVGCASPTRLHNVYGPTEGSMTSFVCPHDPEAVLIGRPIDNTVVMLVDRELRPVPVGTVGEICFGGCIAEGYLHKPELTAKAFVPNTLMAHGADGVPHAPVLYRTGDLAVRLPCGALEYHGRLDRQAKVRGFRIELEAVESILRDYPPLSQSGARLCCVAVQPAAPPNAPAVLVAFVESDVAVSAPCPFEGLLEHAAAHLPAYMVPVRVEALPRLPQLASGKVDLKALASGAHEGTVVDEASSATAEGAVDSLGAVRALSEGVDGSAAAREREAELLDALRAFFMFGVCVDHFGDCNYRLCSYIVNADEMLVTGRGGGLHLGTCELALGIDARRHILCTTALCSVVNNALKMIGNWKCMSGFAMVGAFADSGFAASTRVGRGDAVALCLLVGWMWVLDPLMWRHAPAALCPDSTTAAAGGECGVWTWSVPRWYLQWVLCNKAVVVALRVLRVPPLLQCVLALAALLLLPPVMFCLSEKECANDERVQAGSAIDAWWRQLQPWRWGVWDLLVVGPLGDYNYWPELTHLLSRPFLALTFQYLLVFHYGRAAANEAAAAWAAAMRALAPTNKDASSTKHDDYSTSTETTRKMLSLPLVSGVAAPEQINKKGGLSSSWKRCMRQRLAGLRPSLRPSRTSLARAMALLGCLAVPIALELAFDSDELQHASGRYDLDLIDLTYLDYSASWDKAHGLKLTAGSREQRLSHQLLEMRAIIFLSVQVLFVACTVALALPRKAPRLLRLLGSTTLGAYVLQVYFFSSVHRWYALHLPDARAESGASRYLTVLGGILILLAVPLLLMSTVFPLGHAILFGAIRTALAAVDGIVGLLGRVRVVQRVIHGLDNCWSRVRRPLLMLAACAFIVGLCLLPMPGTS